MLVSTNRKLLGALVAGCLVAATAVTSSHAADETTLRVTVTPGMGSLPFQVASKKGFFAKRGIKVEVTAGVDFTAYIQALDKQFDVVMLTTATTIQAVSAGADLKAYAGMEALAKGVYAAPMVTNKPGIESLEDLAKKGGTLAVPRANDLTRWLMEYYLRQKGQSVASLNLIAIPFVDMADQLRAGRVVAAVSAPGYYEPLLNEGYRVIYEYPKTTLVSAGAELPLVWAHFASTTKFVDRNPEVVTKFQQAIEEAAAWINENKEGALVVYADWLGKDYKSVKDSTVPAWKTRFTKTDVEAWLPILKAGDMLVRPVDSSSFVPALFAGK